MFNLDPEILIWFKNISNNSPHIAQQWNYTCFNEVDAHGKCPTMGYNAINSCGNGIFSSGLVNKEQDI
jgi:hypothetical protein